MRAARVKFKASDWLAGGLILAVLIGLMIFFNAVRGGAANALTRRLPPTVGAEAPDFTLTGLDGKSYRLSALKGTPVVINFWATWCAPCKDELPLIERYSKQYAGKLVVLGVNSEEESGIVRPFILEMEITYPILLDHSGAISDRYFARDLPYTFFIDRDGIIRGQKLGLLYEDALIAFLNQIGIEP
jgi:thiol-disulfide isomerase/thioredoxin